MLFTSANTLALTLLSNGFIIGIAASVGDNKDLKGLKYLYWVRYFQRYTYICTYLHTLLMLQLA